MQFAAAIQVLCDAGVDFTVIGGLSAALHGSATLTYDVDIFYPRTRENLKRLIAALQPYHPRPRDFPPDVPFVWDEEMLRNSPVLTLQTTLGDVDLLAEVAGLGDYETVKANFIEIEAFGRRFATLDLRTLIKTKRAAGREKDLRVIPELESILEAQEP